jgi:hypothetical protein
MALTFRLEGNRPEQCPCTPEFLGAHVSGLHALLLAHGEEVTWPRAAAGAAFYCSLALTLPHGFVPPPQPKRAPVVGGSGSDEAEEEEEAGAAPGSSGTLPSAAQRRLELRVVRRSGGVPVWESPLVTEQRSQAFLVARAGEGGEGEGGGGAAAGAREGEEEEGAPGVTAWRVPPIDAMLLAARALEALLPEEAATAPPLRAFRRRAFDLEEQRARVRAGGQQWTRAEQLKLLAALRAQARQADGTEMSVQHRAVVAAFAQGELAMGSSEEGEEGGGSEGGAGAGAAHGGTGCH